MADDSQMIAKLLSIKAELEDKRKRTVLELDRVDGQIKSITTALAAFNSKQPVPSTTYPLNVPDLRHVTQLEALIRLARENKNRIKVTVARDLFVELGIVKRPKYAYTILTNLIIKSEKFRRVGKGEYELIQSAGTKSGITGVSNLLRVG